MCPQDFVDVQGVPTLDAHEVSWRLTQSCVEFQIYTWESMSVTWDSSLRYGRPKRENFTTCLGAHDEHVVAHDAEDERPRHSHGRPGSPRASPCSQVDAQKSLVDVQLCA